MSSQGLQLQADITNPSLLVLGAIQPLLKAISADDVQPLAVLQAQALGSCFHMNGNFAAKVPDLLARSTSRRLESLSVMIGWQKHDTASFVAQTPHGRSAALLFLVLNELCHSTQDVGCILDRLSHLVLPTEHTNASQRQLEQVVTVLSQKLAAIGFGKLWSTEVKRIFEFCIHTSIPPELMHPFTLETMVDFLHALSRALKEEDAVLFYEGQYSAARFGPLLMALCPEDVWLTIDSYTVHQGPRKNVIFSITTNNPTTKFWVETRISSQRAVEPSVFWMNQDNDTEHWRLDRISFKYEGCLSDALNVTFASYGCKCTPRIAITCANVIAAFAYAPSPQNTVALNEIPLPSKGLHSLLGPHAIERISSVLRTTFSTEVYTKLDGLFSTYLQLCKETNAIVPADICCCGLCRSKHPWLRTDRSNTSETRSRERCWLYNLWWDIGGIIAMGIRLLFVKVAPNCGISGSLGMNNFYTEKILQRINFQPEHDVNEHLTYLSAEKFHEFIIGSEGVANTIGSTFIFPASITYPSINRSWSVEYQMLDGALYNGVNRMNKIVSFDVKNRPHARKSLVPEGNSIEPSPVGCHSELMRTVMHNPGGDLILRTIVEESKRKIELDCRDLQIGLLGMSSATPCIHNPRAPLEQSLHSLVRTTAVSAPVAWGRKIAIVMTQSNNEAQYLSLTGGARVLYQGDCCLDCAVREAERGGFDCIIVA